jgi:4-hydroxy-tetrahydrodipicolinate reductase
VSSAAPAQPLRLALVGHGRMGRLVERLAPDYGSTVALRLTGGGGAGSAAAGDGIDARRFAGIDVAVDFSVPSAVAGNVERIAALGVPLVVGTTGWGEELPRVRAAVERHGIGLVYGANFSVGVQVFYRLVSLAAGLLAHDDDYDAWAYEIHHRKKKDAPSGTLLHLKRRMEEAGYERGIDVASNRAGAVPGTHVVGFDAEADTILLEHRARSRDGFARGALRAARWVVGRRGLYEFSDVWSEL